MRLAGKCWLLDAVHAQCSSATPAQSMRPRNVQLSRVCRNLHVLHGFLDISILLAPRCEITRQRLSSYLSLHSCSSFSSFASCPHNSSLYFCFGILISVHSGICISIRVSMCTCSRIRVHISMNTNISVSISSKTRIRPE